tara:strand:+ start:481 stop:843 length:363 start_codon:yes stop_codon:yes gene_type:complete
MSRSPEVKAAMQKLASSYSEEDLILMQQKVASSLGKLLTGGGLIGAGVIAGRATAPEPAQESPYVSPAVAAALGVAAGYAGSKLPEVLESATTPGYGQFDFTPDDLSMIMSAVKPSRRGY